MPDDPIRLLHFSDLHIGAASYGKTDPETGLPARVGDFFARLDDLLAYAQAHEADAAVFCGNAFKTPHPTPTTQRAFARFVRALAQTCPVVLLVGATDRPTTADKAASIEIFHTLDVPNVTVGIDAALHVIETARGPLQIATLPYLTRADLNLPRRGGDDDGETMQAALVGQLRALADSADADAPRVLAAHLAVAGADTGGGLPTLPTVPVEAVSGAGWDYVALGGARRHQVMHPTRPIIYSGGVERLGFDEAGDAKGCCWAEVMRGSAAWRFVELNARPFVTVTVDARASNDPTGAALAAAERLDLSEAVVRVVVQLEQGNAHLLRHQDLRRALMRLGADHVAAVREQLAPPERGQLGSSPEQLTPRELLARYFEQIEMPPERFEALMRAADELLDDA